MLQSTNPSLHTWQRNRADKVASSLSFCSDTHLNRHTKVVTHTGRGGMSSTSGHTAIYQRVTPFISWKSQRLYNSPAPCMLRHSLAVEKYWLLKNKNAGLFDTSVAIGWIQQAGWTHLSAHSSHWSQLSERSVLNTNMQRRRHECKPYWFKTLCVSAC